MVICKDIENLKITIRSILVATMDALTVEELWDKLIKMYDGAHNIQLHLFGYNTFFELLMHIPNVVQLEDPENENTIVNLVSSTKSRHMEILVSYNIKKPPSLKQRVSKNDLVVPYRVQCAFIRVLIELYPKGLSISNFLSDVMCYPIFKSFIDNYELLLYNLAHIFKRYGQELLCLQPRIVNKVQCLKEKNKLTAIEIFAIDQDLLENTIVDQQLANELEYPLFNILEEPIKNNIKILLEEQPSWITERQICNLYNDKFGSSFSHFRRWGFTRVSIMFSKLPELCHINFSTNEIEIISLKTNTFDESKKQNLAKEINEDQTTLSLLPIVRTFSKDRSEKKNEGLLNKFLINDPYLKIPLNDCFLDLKVQPFELKLNESYNILVCRVDVDLISTIICQNDESIELKNFLIDMKNFYVVNESKFKFDSTIAMVQHTYAYFFDGMWHRGLVIEIGFYDIKVINIDDGSVNIIAHEDLRLLYKKFSELPAQSFECQLYGLTHINETVINQIINKKCIIHVVQIDQFDKLASVKIKYLNSTSCEYLNDEWISSSAAIAKTGESFSNEK